MTSHPLRRRRMPSHGDDKLTINNEQLIRCGGEDFSTQNPSDSLVEMTPCHRGYGEREDDRGTVGEAQMNN